MSTIELLDEAIKRVPEALLYGKIKTPDERVILFKDYLKEENPKRIITSYIEKYPDIYTFDENGIDNLKDVIVNRIAGSLVISAEDKVDFIDTFINTMGDDFVSTVELSENNIIDVRENLLNKIKFMNDEYQIKVGETYKTVGQVYETILKNHYQRLTIVDKQEIVDYLYNKYLNYFLSNNDYITEAELMHEYDADFPSSSPYAYIVDNIVSYMINASEVKIGDTTKNVDDIIEKIFLDRLNKVETRRIAINNRVNETPSELGEIKLEELDDKLSVTATHLPTLNGDVLTDEEISSLSRTSNELINMDEEKYIKDQLYNIKDDINNALSKYDLDRSIQTFEKYKGMINNHEFDSLIYSIEELVISKTKNLIKVEGNKEELNDVTYGKLAELKRQLNSIPDGESYEVVNNQFNKILKDIIEKNITDDQIISLVKDLNNTLAKKHVLRDISDNFNYQNVQRVEFDVFMANANIKKNLISRSYCTKNIDIAKLDANTKAIYEETRNSIREYYNNRLINEEVFDKYLNIMEDIYNEYAYQVNLMEVNNEEKGYGI